MSGTHAVVMGDRGRLVVPADVRERTRLQAGTPLVLMETDRGLLLLTRQQALAVVREELDGPSLVDELLRERRQAALTDDAV